MSALSMLLLLLLLAWAGWRVAAVTGWDWG
jgi:hypothetical protein